MIRLISFGLCCSFLLMFSACKSIEAFPDPNGPIFLNNSTSHQGDTVRRSFSIVTFNIRQSRNVDQAIDELRSDSAFARPDILLLQEMNEESVVRIAKIFGLNSLYFPIGSNEYDHSNFGNAILTSFPISKPSKLILPHKKIDGRIRNATNCAIQIGDQKILIYSIHNETILMSKSKRIDQVDAILDDIHSKEHLFDAVIVGGDFNTLFKKYRKTVAEKFRNNGFTWATCKIGGTSTAFFNMIKPANDHFFAKHLQPIRIEKLESSTASDHLPVLMTFRLNEDDDHLSK